MKQEVGDSLTIIGYHRRSDGWHNADGDGRASYYGVSATPTIICEGTELPWDGGANYNYNGFRKEFNELKVIPPDAEIILTGEYDESSGEGSVTASIKNITSSGISGKCYFAICQKDTPFVWQTETELHHIERKMLPDYNGTSVSIDADDSTEVTQSFTVQSSWQRDNCYVVVFIQNSSEEILQTIELDLLELVTTNIIKHSEIISNLIVFKKTSEYFMVYVPFEGSYTVTISDVHGKRISSFTSSGKKQWYNISKSLSSGIHILSISTSKKIFAKKFCFVR